jgi:hypothetical protein
MLVVAVITILCLPAALSAQRLRDRDRGPSVNRRKILEMGVEAQKLAAEGAKLRKEAVEGRVPDKSRPRTGEGEKEPKWIELTSAERLRRFAQARAKYLAAVAKAAEAEAFLKKHPGIALEDRPTTGKERLTEQYAATVVAEARFRMAEDIGTIAQWKKLAAQALKADKDSLEAQRLVEEIKKREQEEREAKANKGKKDADDEDEDDDKEADSDEKEDDQKDADSEDSDSKEDD